MTIDKKLCIIFPHIPKCGGTTLRSQLKESHLNIYFDYDVPPHINKFFRNACETRNKEASFLDFSLFDLVFGHFPINRYKSNNYKYVTLLRHPVDRAISQYFYWKNIVPENNLLALYRYPTITDIKNGNISFIDFLKTQKIGSFYSNYLGDKSPDEFLLVALLKATTHFYINYQNC